MLQLLGHCAVTHIHMWHVAIDDTCVRGQQQAVTHTAGERAALPGMSHLQVVPAYATHTQALVAMRTASAKALRGCKSSRVAGLAARIVVLDHPWPWI